MIQIITLNQNQCTASPEPIVNLPVIDDLKYYY